MNPTISRILVPVDFSSCSEVALRHAIALAEQLSASLHLLHVVEQPMLPATWGTEIYTPTDLPDLQEELVAEAKRQLTMQASLVKAKGLTVATNVLTGHAATTIAHFASDIGADLVVMGTHGRSGLSHLVMGSVAEHVIREAPCPVLTVRAIVKDGRHIRAA